MGDFFGSLIGAAGNLLGGILGQNTQSNIAQQNLAFQEQMASSGIQMKVADARKAGISPLVALGAQTFNPSPVSVSSNFGEGVSAAGQNLGRAVSSLMPDQKSRADQLNEELLQAKIDNVQADTTHQFLLNSRLATAFQPGNPPSRGSASFFDFHAPGEAPKLWERYEDKPGSYVDLLSPGASQSVMNAASLPIAPVIGAGLVGRNLVNFSDAVIPSIPSVRAPFSSSDQFQYQ